ncbi:MAG: thioesterase family protein [Desulfotignum sp.]
MSKIDLSKLKIGMESTLSIVVSNENSAEAVGYKGMSVLGTPHLVGVMETACIFVHEFLPENCLTVGVANSMKHLAPSPIGATVKAKARLSAIEGRKLTYDVEAHDSVEKVAEGTHTRVIIDSRDFFANIEKKKQKLGLI